MPSWDHTFENWLWREDAIEPVAEEPHPTVVFDIDGVLSDASTRQHFIEYPRRDWEAFFHACGDDELIDEVGRMLEVIDASYRLDRSGLRWDLLIMRDFGDYSAARTFKLRTVHELRSRAFDLRLAFEDDPRNVDMFHSQGVPCVYIHSGYYE